MIEIKSELNKKDKNINKLRINISDLKNNISDLKNKNASIYKCKKRNTRTKRKIR